jgi:signal transduction histidine kinase
MKRRFRLCGVIAVIAIGIVSCQNYKTEKPKNFAQLDSVYEHFLPVFDTNSAQAKSSVYWLRTQSQKLNYQKGEANADALISYVFEQNGSYDSAIHYNLSALKLRQQLNDSEAIINTYLNLARNYLKVKATANQNLYLKLAFAWLRTYHNPEQHFEAYSQAAVTYAAVGQYDSAKVCFNTALGMAQNIESLDIKAKAFINYANILNQIDAIDSALYFYRLGIPIYQSQKSRSQLSGIYNNIALVFWDKGNRDSTLYYLDKGYAQTKLVGNKRDLENTVLNLIDFWEEQSDLPKSNMYLHELLVLKDSVFEENLHQSLADIELNYKVKLKQEENEKLKFQLSRKNTIRNAAIALSILVTLLAWFLLRIYRQKRLLAQHQKELAVSEIDRLLRERELQNLDAMLEGRETERKRIGRDLHDRLGSILSTVKLYFSVMDDKLDAIKSENRVQYKKASDLLDEAVTEVRRISQDLVSGVLVKSGLVAALLELKKSLELSGKIKINVFEAGESFKLLPETEIELYRIIQELISNILKHANAQKADIHLSRDGNQFTIMVEDDGIGFDISKPAQFGLGISNIRQRVAMLGGVVSFDSSQGAGTTVIIELDTEQGDLTEAAS